MTTDPIHNPGVSPSQPVPSFGQPQVGPGDQQEQQRTFTLPTESPSAQGSPGQATGANTPSPMQMMSAAATEATNKVSPEQLTQGINQLQNQFTQIQSQLQDPQVTNNLSPDHLNAMKQLAEELNPHMRAIANETEGQFQSPQIKSGSILKDIATWVNGSQKTFGGALQYLSSANGKQIDVASMMRLQYSVQRASQRGELFSSIISSTVSGIKTIMSTQLG